MLLQPVKLQTVLRTVCLFLEACKIEKEHTITHLAIELQALYVVSVLSRYVISLNPDISGITPGFDGARCILPDSQRREK